MDGISAEADPLRSVASLPEAEEGSVLEVASVSEEVFAAGFAEASGFGEAGTADGFGVGAGMALKLAVMVWFALIPVKE